MLRKGIHINQLVLHIYFMHWNFFYQSEFSLLNMWHQIKFLTIFSNVNMFLFLVPFVATDLKHFSKKQYEYPILATLAFEVMNPIIFIVMFSYWLLFAIDPTLLFGARDPNDFDQRLMFYLHGGNFILMQFEYLICSPHTSSTLKKTKCFFCYTLIYFTIYGVHWYIYNEHIYGFQMMMTINQVIMMYIGLFLVMILIDQFYSKIITQVIQKKRKQI